MVNLLRKTMKELFFRENIFLQSVNSHNKLRHKIAAKAHKKRGYSYFTKLFDGKPLQLRFYLQRLLKLHAIAFAIFLDIQLKRLQDNHIHPFRRKNYWCSNL